MEEQSNELAPSLTQESLKEKVELANERRNQVRKTPKPKFRFDARTNHVYVISYRTIRTN